jgi:hypothetical protein
MSDLPTYPQRLVDAAKANKKLSPRALGELVDAHKAYEAARLAADKVAEALKAQETELKQAIIAALKKAETTVAGGAVYAVELKQEDQPTVKDWPFFYKHLVETKSFDLLERRISKAAVKARWEDGKPVPGVDKFPVDKLSFRKLKG